LPRGRERGDQLARAADLPCRSPGCQSPSELLKGSLKGQATLYKLKLKNRPFGITSALHQPDPFSLHWLCIVSANWNAGKKPRAWPFPRGKWETCVARSASLLEPARNFSVKHFQPLKLPQWFTPFEEEMFRTHLSATEEDLPIINRVLFCFN